MRTADSVINSQKGFWKKSLEVEGRFGCESFPPRDDNYASPKGGFYMARHLTVLQRGKPIEIQIKTERQQKFHDKIHRRYKEGKKVDVVRLKKRARRLRELDES